MRIDATPFRVELPAGQLLKLEGPRGLQVTCEAGHLGITEEAQPDDDWLAATTGLLQAIRHAAPNTPLFLRGDSGSAALLLYVDGTVALSP